MRVLLADSNPEVRAALRLVIEQRAGIRVTGEAADTISLFAQAAAIQEEGTCPDVILLDAGLPGLQIPRRAEGAPLSELIQALRALCPRVSIIALSSQPTAAKACLQASADAFICKSDPPEPLLALLEEVLHSSRQDANRMKQGNTP